MSPEQLAKDRADYVAVWDRNAATARFEGGNAAAAYSPEARAAWIAAFDAAAAADGNLPTEPPTADVLRHYENHGLPFEPQASDYKPYFGELARELPPERLAVVDLETREWAAAIGFNSHLGGAVIERLAEVGPKLQAMTPEARQAWLQEQERIGLQRAGSTAAFAEMKQRARAALEIAKGNALSNAVMNSTAVNDVWLLTTLANHHRAVESFAASHPHDRRQ